MNNKLKEVRENKGISQEELSLKSGVSRTTISSLENQKAMDVKSSTLISLANALEMEITDIFFN
ncbi:MAG: helix-turn-helix transcriptional regulator [Tissierellia bacterium]|nr:helix-turn-helix transcriptional regulator [Tissierellia bacterium]